MGPDLSWRNQWAKFRMEKTGSNKPVMDRDVVFVLRYLPWRR